MRSKRSDGSAPEVTDAVTGSRTQNTVSPAETRKVTGVTGQKVDSHRRSISKDLSLDPSHPSLLQMTGDGCDGSVVPSPTRAHALSVNGVVPSHPSLSKNPQVRGLPRVTDPSLLNPYKPRKPLRRRVAKPTDPTGAGITARIVAARTPDGDVFHLAPVRPVRVGYIICGRAEPLCGTSRRLRLPGLLFHTEITCWICALIAERDGLVVAIEAPGAAFSGCRPDASPAAQRAS